MNLDVVIDEKYVANLLNNIHGWWKKGQYILFITWPRDSHTYCHETRFTQLSIDRWEKSTENTCNLNEVRGDNKACTLIRITQLSKFCLQQYVILHFELFLNQLLSCLG